MKAPAEPKLARGPVEQPGRPGATVGTRRANCLRCHGDGRVRSLDLEWRADSPPVFEGTPPRIEPVRPWRETPGPWLRLKRLLHLADEPVSSMRDLVRARSRRAP